MDDIRDALPAEPTEDDAWLARVEALAAELQAELRRAHPRFRAGAAEPLPAGFWQGYLTQRLDCAQEASRRHQWRVLRVRLLEIAAFSMTAIDHLDRREIAAEEEERRA